MNFLIRKCVLTDCIAICALNRDGMGYTYTEKQTGVQLSTVLNDASNVVFVAVNGDEVIGYTHGMPT